MTKYMTKTQLGSVLTVMENSFAKCMDKAREEGRGVRSATAKYFNLAATQDVKSQLETMHLLFRLPRYLCSRKFRRLSTRNESKMLKKAADIDVSAEGQSLTHRTRCEKYLAREESALPTSNGLCDLHPVSGIPMWQCILMNSGVSGVMPEPSVMQGSVEDAMESVKAAWPKYLRRLSWWEFERLMYKDRNHALRFKDTADVVIVTPAPRFATVSPGVELALACRNALLAYCNHGPNNEGFQNAATLSALSDDKVCELMRDFALSTPAERVEKNMCECPVFLRRAWMLSKIRLDKQLSKKLSILDVHAALGRLQDTQLRGIAASRAQDWRLSTWSQMSEEHRTLAVAAWKEADVADVDRLRAEAKNSDETGATGMLAMRSYMKVDLHIETRQLHDACIAIGAVPDGGSSLLNYFEQLNHFCGRDGQSFMPQKKATHKAANLKAVLKALQSGGAKLGGLSGNKEDLAQRLCTILRAIMDRGCITKGYQAAEEAAQDADGEDLCGYKGLAPELRRQVLAPARHVYPEVPSNACVTAEQAESSLGHNPATHIGNEEDDDPDGDVQAEAEMLYGCAVNPKDDVDYSCLSVDVQTASKSVLASLGNPEYRGRLCKEDFLISPNTASQVLTDSVGERRREFAENAMNKEAMARLEKQLSKLDPTQRRVCDDVKKWAIEASLADKKSGVMPDPLRMLLLGTAGTGKTVTVQSAVAGVRLAFESFDSVRMVAHTGVAASNMGPGATTIMSLFKLSGTEADADLEGERLTEFMTAMAGVRLIVIDEISTASAWQFEMIHRRLEQLRRSAVRQTNDQYEVEDSSHGFGDISLLLVGDFGQLPPVSGTSLIASGAGHKQSASGVARARNLQGQRRFQEFHNVIMFRRIYRQKQADHFKDSTLRLRDCAPTAADYELWKKHEIPDSKHKPSWDGGASLLETGLFITVENAICGRKNGERLRARARLPGDMGVIVKMKAWHSKRRAEKMNSDNFRQLKVATHLSVGAPVMLTQNRIWDVDTVSLGLMNGAQGVVVAILYLNSDEVRDLFPLVPTGFPSERTFCPLPNMVIVNFPTYTGKPFFPRFPKTWVPIPLTRCFKTGAADVCRVTIPLRLCWALTGHKCQGITCPQGNIVDFSTTKPRNPVKTMGLGFVSVSRVQEYASLAFIGLPPLLDFFAPRSTKEFKDRCKFEEAAARYHETYLWKSQSWTVDREVEEHIKHKEKQESRALSEEECQQLRGDLTAVGVAEIPVDVLRGFAVDSGLKESATLGEISASFAAARGRNKPSDGLAMQKKLTKKASASKKKKKGDVDTSIVKDGPDGSGIGKECGFESIEKEMGLLSGKACTQPKKAELGEKDLKIILAKSGMHPDKPDQARKSLWLSIGKRRSAVRKVTKMVVKSSDNKEYEDRARNEWPEFQWKVVDVGVQAGGHTNACLWLSVVAGLSRCARYDCGDASLQIILEDAFELKNLPISDFDLSARPSSGDDEIGWVADRLRQFFCGDNGCMRKSPMLDEYLNVFTYSQSIALPGKTADYEKWLSRVADSEFADELIVSALAVKLLVCIIIVPVTPAASQCKWAVVTHPNEETPERSQIPPERRIVIGNNNVHFVWLSQSKI